MNYQQCEAVADYAEGGAGYGVVAAVELAVDAIVERGSEPGEATGVGSSECTGAEKGSWNWKNPADMDSCTAGWPLPFHRWLAYMALWS